jgi:hypothetical protein
LVISKFYSRKGLWLLFSVSAFLVHVWALLLIFQDLSWLAERTNMWDAIGVGAYGLVFALLESVIVFVAAIFLGFLVLTAWNETTRISLLGSLVMMASIWAILGQLNFMLGWSPPASLIQWLASTEHPLRILYLLVLLIVTPTVGLTVFAQLKFNKLNRWTYGFFDRLSLLLILYLLMDLISIIILLIRNV